VSKAEAQAQAEELAAQLQEQGAEAKQARKEGKEANVKALVTAARARRRPQPGMTIAGKKHRSLWLKDFVNNWFGRRFRFLLGAALFALGLLWLHQNGQLKGNPAFEALLKFDIGGAQKAFMANTKPLNFPGIDALPDALLPAFNTWALPLTGLMLLLNAALYFGWRPTVVTLPGVAVALFGPVVGIPDAGPLLAQHISLIAGAIVILILARFVRQ
jgi:eukaryotic-like serine/threonine-protein kinase